MTLVMGCEVRPYLLRARPLGVTERTLAWHIVLVSYVPYQLLASPIFSAAIAMTTEPLLESFLNVIGARRTFCFRD